MFWHFALFWPVKIKLSLFLFFAIFSFPTISFLQNAQHYNRNIFFFYKHWWKSVFLAGTVTNKRSTTSWRSCFFTMYLLISSSSLPPHSASSLVAGWQFKWTFNPNQGALQELAGLPSPKWRREMDTLGVCGTPSIAADNGVIMVKEPRLERVSDNLDPPTSPQEALNLKWCI